MAFGLPVALDAADGEVPSSCFGSRCSSPDSTSLRRSSYSSGDPGSMVDQAQASSYYSESGGDRFAKAEVSTNGRDVAHDSRQYQRPVGGKSMEVTTGKCDPSRKHNFLDSGGIGLSSLLKSVCAMLDSRLGEGSTSRR